MDLLRFWLISTATCACATRSAALFGGYTLPASVRLRNGQTFDYVVVGAGAGGAAVAARLALAGADVLLVEAGGDPDPISEIPDAANALLGGPLDWQYETISNNKSCLSYRGRQCRFSRGKCLGGSTSINFMMYTRGSPDDFDSLNIPGWTWEDVKPYFLKYEGLQVLAELPVSSIPYHNTTGTMKIEFFNDPNNAWHPKIVEGFEQLNFPFNPDINGPSQIGVTKVIGYVHKGQRMSTARGYLSRDDVRKRLKVAKRTRCTGVIVDNNNTARGVTVAYSIFKKQLKIYARKEVILSAGTIGTPQILMLSGIGPADHLREMKIQVKVDLPVGDNMTDHLLPLVFVKVDGDNKTLADLIKRGVKVISDAAQLLRLNGGPLGSNGLTDISAFMNTDCYDFENRQLINDSSECELATLQFIHSYIPRNTAFLLPDFFQQGTDLNDDVVKQLKKFSSEYAFLVLSPVVLQPYSQGYVRLASRDPLAMPAIFPDYLSDERDLEQMVKALKVVEHLVETPAFRGKGAEVVRLELPGCPDHRTDLDGYLTCYSRQMTHTVYHATGTAAIGRVLDERLRVRGVARLRVADLSAAPRLPRANTAATAIAIGERAADFILQDEQSDDKNVKGYD